MLPGLSQVLVSSSSLSLRPGSISVFNSLRLAPFMISIPFMIKLL